MSHELATTNGRSGIAEPTIPHVTDRSCQPAQLSEHQLIDLNDKTKQAEYRQAYQLQLHRQACPGCGDE